MVTSVRTVALLAQPVFIFLAVLRAAYAGQGALSFWHDRAEAQRQHRPIIAGQHLVATVRRG
ncbi:MAG: hypothetical protein OHK0015_12080 [Chloroflexi bacterium OHK40]